jgi:hypothetical protein
MRLDEVKEALNKLSDENEPENNPATDNEGG